MKHHVMISGATGGLGRAFAVECASRGWDLYLTDLRPEALKTLATALAGTYDVQVKWRSCDLTDSDQRSALFEALAAEQVRFSVLINVAGGDHEGLFCEQSRDHIRSILRLNTEAALEMTHALVSLRDTTSVFRVLNVASLGALAPIPYKATYAASKRFLLDFSLALREELRDQGVTVTVLCPAGMPTTHECIAAIEAQGLMGHLTTQNTGAVAASALDAALRGKAVVIPGWINRTLSVIGGRVPPGLAAQLIGRRWKAANGRRMNGRTRNDEDRRRLAAHPSPTGRSIGEIIAHSGPAVKARVQHGPRCDQSSRRGPTRSTVVTWMIGP